MSQRKQKLELRWVGKDRVLLGLDAGGKPLWGDWPDIDPRPFWQLEQVGDPKAENILIKGDNLYALKSLERDFAGKIKCIYIDPPFNTGNAFEHYDDGLEHSIWLSMMKSRLEILKTLLSDDGVIFVEIDDSEQAHLKVLMDEIFGRSNYVLSVAVKRSAATGHKTINPSPVNVCEFIHIYTKRKAKWKYHPQSVARGDYDWAYKQVLVNRETQFSRWRFEPLAEVVARNLKFGNAKEARKSAGKKNFDDAMVGFALKNSESVTLG